MAESEKPEIDEIARAICDSEPFMWLMVGSNHTESQLAALREAWHAYTTAGGGYGNRARGKGVWAKPTNEGEPDG